MTEITFIAANSLVYSYLVLAFFPPPPPQHNLYQVSYTKCAPFCILVRWWLGEQVGDVAIVYWEQAFSCSLGLVVSGRRLGALLALALGLQVQAGPVLLKEAVCLPGALGLFLMGWTCWVRKASWVTLWACSHCHLKGNIEQGRAPPVPPPTKHFLHQSL